MRAKKSYRLLFEQTTSAMASSTRSQVVSLYKNLLYLGKEYPKGYIYFRERLKKAFLKHKDESCPEKIDMLIARGDYVHKELEALYMLRKYRTLKQRYYVNDPVKETITLESHTVKT